ncbi:type VI secretion system lipoprotein TssJ [Pseudomonas helleri]|uniref:Type VI secretion system lipoprotein TssJ n=1 Tax=Pseudomonas helleri TaxID=1608996 RepID=A0A7X2CEU7_9PSED|nr:type VI secretion system lipoprotein TssJ [Pseudomonas helleri]MQU28847.1 type VI secretion system lipoprotein TssJ [Pseudomonas helleri]
MSRTVFNVGVMVVCAALLGGCGVTQKVTDATVSTAKAIFYKHVKTLHLDFSARVALNSDTTEMSALSVPTLVRVYQLRDKKAVEMATYDLLVSDDDKLGSELLGTQAVVVKPGEGVQLNVPLQEQAQFVAVVALFRTPNAQTNTWRLILTRDDLDPDQPRVIELGNNRLTLRPLAKD